jgi:hypothetical protein
VSGHEVDGPTRSRRLLLGATLGAAVVATSGLLLLAPGDEAYPDLANQVVAAAGSDEVDSAPGDAEVEPEALPVVTYDVFLDRDPFEPVLEEGDGLSDDGGGQPVEQAPEPAAIGAGLPAGTIIIDPTTGQAIVVQKASDSGTDAEVDGNTDSSPSPNPTTGCRGEDEVVCDGRVVTLIEVGSSDAGPTARVQVDDVIYEVTTGEVFATSFRLLTIDGSCVTLQYGDDTVRLCEGQRVLK